MCNIAFWDCALYFYDGCSLLIDFADLGYIGGNGFHLVVLPTTNLQNHHLKQGKHVLGPVIMLFWWIYFVLLFGSPFYCLSC